MPELPEVETLRRMLEARVVSRVVARATRSRARLHTSSRGGSLESLEGGRITAVERRGKYLLFRFDSEHVMLSHLGMSGRWLFYETPPAEELAHVHAKLEFDDGTRLWFQDARRFGQLRVLAGGSLERDASLLKLGRDPLDPPITADDLIELSRGSKASVKLLLLDQGRIAGIGNIYASEILHCARVDPRRRAGTLSRAEWADVAPEVVTVLSDAIERMGTTFSMYRTIWGESGQYGEQLRVYDRAGEPCHTCGTPIRRLVQAQRSTFFCPVCQRRKKRGK